MGTGNLIKDLISGLGGGGGPTTGNIVVTGSNHTQVANDIAIYATATLDVTLLNHLTAVSPIDIRCDAGTTTLLGTTDTPTLTVGQTIRLYPTPTGWRYNG